MYRSKVRYRGSPLVSGRSTIVPAYFPGPSTEAKCSDCLGYVATSLAGCYALLVADVAAECLNPFGWFGACETAIARLPGEIIICDAESVSGIGYCDAQRCCPKVCGPPNPLIPGSGCCDHGEHCVDQNDPNSRDGCCPSDQSICGDKCCPPGVSCCGNECGCPGTSTCVQGQCCPPGANRICNGACCQGPCDSDGNCCDSPNHVCGGLCCPPLNECCNGQCCGLGQQCHPTLGTCCSTICGPACCGAGQFCQDPQRGVAEDVPLVSTHVMFPRGLSVVQMGPSVARMDSVVRPIHVASSAQAVCRRLLPRARQGKARMGEVFTA